jgi:hypothetical protein
MPIYNPEEFMALPEQELAQQAHVEERSLRMRSKQEGAGKLPEGLAVAGTCSYIGKLTGIYLSEPELQGMFSLYPAERARLARYTTSDLAKAESARSGTGNQDSYLIANVVADFFGRTVWPSNDSSVDRGSFALRLRKAAHKMGYNVIHPTALAS